MTVETQAEEYRKQFNFNLQVGQKLLDYERSLGPEYWNYRREWDENPRLGVLDRYPIHLDIESTNRCNMSCTMCPRTDMVQAGLFPPNRDFDVDAYAGIVRDGEGKGLRSVKLNILGEPTLHPRLSEMIRLAKDAGVIEVLVNTNGLALGQELSRKLILSGLDKLLFSFDSPYRETYNAIRKGGDYDRTLDNVRRFMGLRESMGGKTPFTRATMVMMEETRDGWEDFQRLFEPLVDSIAFTNYLRHEGHSAAVTPERRELVQSFRCPQLWQRMFVHVNGDCRVCCMDSYRSVMVGNVLTTSVPEIWLGEVYQGMRKLHMEGRAHEIPMCSRCSIIREAG